MNKTIVLMLMTSLFFIHCKVTAAPVDVVAKTLYYEARGEGEEGLRAVATILLNRAEKSYGKTSVSLCAKEAQKKFQFSCWNGKKDLKPGKGDSWALCVAIAKEVSAGKFQKTHGYTHYYAYNKCSPKWAKGKTGLVIGNHKFLKV